jgi:hypothetical protein
VRCGLLAVWLCSVLNVQILDFHSNCSRRYAKAQLDQLHPVAYSHPITHYPLASMPPVREKEFDITAVYADRAPEFAWSSEGFSVAKEDESEEDEKKKEEETLAIDSAADASPAAACAPPAAASSSSTPDVAAASFWAALRSVIVPSSARPLGRLELTVVSDVDYRPGFGFDANPMPSRVLWRSIPCRADDPMCTKFDGHPLNREQSLRRMLAIMEFNRHEWLRCVETELRVELIQVGQPEDGSVKPVRKGDAKYSSLSKKQQSLEEAYKKQLHHLLWSPSFVETGDEQSLLMRSFRSKLQAIEKKQRAAMKKALADGVIQEDDISDFVVSEDDEPEPKPAPARPAAAAAAPSSINRPFVSSMKQTVDENGVMEKTDDDGATEEDPFATYADKHNANSLVDEHGSLWWYRLTMEFHLCPRGSKDPKRTSEEATPLNELMLLLFPHSDELRRLSREAVKEMPSYLSGSLSLDGLLKHSAHYHHTLAEKEEKQAAEAEEQKGGEMKDDVEEDGEAAWKKMDATSLSRAAHLVPSCTLKDYQVQTVQWMLRAESAESNVSHSFWVTLSLEDGCKFQYSPFLQRVTFSPHPNVKGGWICEEVSEDAECRVEQLSGR